AWMATRPSPPGRFSIMTGLPQRAGSRSDNSLAAISAPAPGPNGTTNLTGRCGQFCADDGAGATARKVNKAAEIAALQAVRCGIRSSNERRKHFHTKLRIPVAKD